MVVIEKSDVIMILDGQWDGCLAVVTEVRDWGVQCYVKIPMKGDAYYRVDYNKFVKVGSLKGIIEEVQMVK